MASFTYLSDKKCACCLTRLDKVPKRGLLHTNNDDNFLSKINTIKPIILSKKGKIYDNIPIVLWNLSRFINFFIYNGLI